jgi:hypothetical protein
MGTTNPANGSKTELVRPAITAEQIQVLMERIRNTWEGAFAPVSQQPALQALLLPFGGLGSATDGVPDELCNIALNQREPL